MFYRFPEATRGVVRRAYLRPYPDPIRVKAGAVVTPDTSRITDVVGWVWCKDADGRSGWVPEAWIDRSSGVCRMRSDFDALELTVTPGDRLILHFSESGFLWVTDEKNESGWVPDGCVALETSQLGRLNILDGGARCPHPGPLMSRHAESRQSTPAFGPAVANRSRRFARLAPVAALRRDPVATQPAPPYHRVVERCCAKAPTCSPSGGPSEPGREASRRSI